MIATVPKSEHRSSKRSRPEKQFTKQQQTLSVQLLKDTHARIAQRAIIYRIPTEVTHVIKFSNGDTYSKCPRCYSLLDREYMNYCDSCGQKLAWNMLKHAIVVYHCYKKNTD